MRPQQPRPIEPTDDVGTFDSGESSLDHYLSRRALANHHAGVARCYVSIERGTKRVLGFYTLSAVAVRRTAISARARRNTPDPVPAVLLGRLAVDRRAQGSGLGRLLVRDAILSTMSAADRIGVRLLLVHALHDQAAQFYTALGFRPSPTDPLHLYLLLDDVRKSLRP